MSEINDEQLQEFEAKLEALTQRLEEIELSPDNFDPFDLYDVERMLEDFRTKEQSLNSEVERVEVEGAEVEESFSFEVGSVSKKRPVFEVHWIGIDECGVSSCESILSNVEAKSAFLNAIDYRADNSNGKRRVKHGDLLILLCRNSGNLAEDAPEGSEPLTKSCTYMGMFTRHGYRQSAEPDALPVVESKISDSNDYGDVFVWSSCSDVVCDENSTTVDISTGSQLTVDSGSEVGEELEFLTAIEVEKDNVETGYDAKGLVIDNDIAVKTAGLYGGLNTLSTKLTDWYVNYSKFNFKPKADVSNLKQSAEDFNTLSSDQCGNLLLTSEDSSGDGSPTLLSSFNKNFEVSLGNITEVDNSEIEGVSGIPTIDLDFTDYGTNTNVFLPTIDLQNATSIVASNSLDFLSEYKVTMEASYSVVYESEGKGDAEYRFYKTEKNVSGVAFASGLLTNAGVENTSSKELIGLIRVKEAPLAYSCDPDYGCRPDPSGEFDEPTCDNSCSDASVGPILTYRPSKIYRLDMQNVGGLPSCRVREIWTRSDEPLHMTADSHTYMAAAYEHTAYKTLYVNETTSATLFGNAPLDEVNPNNYYSSSPCS